MNQNRSSIALLCSLLLLAPAGGFAADPPARTPNPTNQDNTAPQPEVGPHGVLGRVSDPYRPKAVPPPNLSNSNRLDSLLRAGNLYLSLQDAIALALENNLDIAIQRYGPQLADTAVMSAEAG